MQERFHLESLYTAVRITDFHYVTAEAGWSYPDHKHTVLEFQYCVSGVLPLHVDGESCMLQPGEAAVILPGLYHRTEPLPGDCEYFVFHFHLESDRVNAAFLLLDRPHLRPGFGVDPDRHIPNWIDRFLAEYGDSLPGKRAARSVAGAEDARQALFYLRLQARLLEFIGILGGDDRAGGRAPAGAPCAARPIQPGPRGRLSDGIAVPRAASDRRARRPAGRSPFLSLRLLQKGVRHAAAGLYSFAAHPPGEGAAAGYRAVSGADRGAASLLLERSLLPSVPAGDGDDAGAVSEILNGHL
ncbi:cupin domain-containing protein [Cohnella ginsengisoli]|uniref:Cupin domain-containing protein n=1 Tax=Cohnella ginsengisoli TaxID=425004 RepID=A0A9X4QRF7_9BACL|nr:cupin domain-containing protein [Cohnella ginsengisoli]MDG0794825.1 cupin domain-containing protein [Cohnella ginsengisoli]